MTIAYIGLGSNLDDPAQHLRDAVRALTALPKSELQSLSRVYRSAAVGPGNQPDYLNAAARLQTELAPQALLAELQRIEDAQGRVRPERWAARTLDLDLLLYGDLQMDSGTLTLPHPRMGERDFVLVPLRDVCDTNLVLPDGSDLDTLLLQCPDSGMSRTDHHLGNH
jgi:2-amino-4-hydroxy-6-hydroxymethyldihydropteridine diphosphokinase